MQNVTIFDSVARTVSATSTQQGFLGGELAAAVFFLNITAATGTTPTLDVKIQGQDPLSGTWYDIPGAAFAQKTAAGVDTLVIAPSVTTVVGKATSQVIPSIFRAVATVAGTTPSFTFSLAAQSLA